MHAAPSDAHAAVASCSSRSSALAALAAAPPLSDLHHTSQWGPAGFEAAHGRLEDFLRREGATAAGKWLGWLHSLLFKCVHSSHFCPPLFSFSLSLCKHVAFLIKQTAAGVSALQLPRCGGGGGPGTCAVAMPHGRLIKLDMGVANENAFIEAASRQVEA